MDGSSLSAGPVLRFSITGEGVSINPETGELSLLTNGLLQGFAVTVTLADESGTNSRVFRLAMEPQEAAAGVAPQPTARPVLEGTGEVGTVVTVDPGQWSGAPDPEIALQWCLDGEAIAGASAAEYAPDPASDGRSLSCRVTARNAAGSASAETDAVDVRFAAPTVVDRLADLVAREGDEPLVVEAAAAFAGAGITFAVTGAEATIDAATGRLTIPTAAPRAAERVVVTATNSGGAASVDFRVTVEARAPDAPFRIPATLWSAEEVRDAAPEGRRRVSISPEVAIPAGFELRLYSGSERLASQPSLNTTRAMQPGETFTTRGVLPVGTVCHNLLFWHRLADGEWTQASQNTVVFEIAGLQPAEPAKPLPVAPAVVSAPVLAGSGKIGGGELAVDAGSWSGEPEISLQWLRDRKPIPGATAAVYAPVPEDDLTEVCCRVTARNAAGATEAEAEAVRITHLTPVAVGEIPDEIFDEDTGAQEVPTAQAFEGRNLAFTVTGAGASIDAATGVVTIDTATPGVETITVAAANSGGEATQSFLVTVEALPAIQPEPPAIAADLWLLEAGEWSAERGGARMSITPGAAIKVPEGCELRCYIGSNPAGVGATGMTVALVPGTRFTTNGFFSGDLHARLFWRELASDGYRIADTGGKTLRVEAPVPATPAVPNQLPPWNQIVRSEAELKAAIAAHANDATSWRVGLAPGDYGTLNLAEIRSVRGAPVIFGSADYAGLGAKVRRLLLTNSDRLQGWFLDVDRAGHPGLGTGVNNGIVMLHGAIDCGLRWSRIRGGAWNARTANSQPYLAGAGASVHNTSLRNPERCFLHHCAIGGHLENGIYWTRGDDSELIGCVFFDMGGDNVRVSAPARFKMIDNWGARRHRIFDPGDGKHDHLDFYQSYAGMSQSTRIPAHTIRGNVWMPDAVTDREGTPTQAICNHDNVVDDFIIEQNIIVTTSVWGIAFAANKSYSSPTPGQRNRVANNTVFRWVNSQNVMAHNATITVHGANDTPGSGNNIHLHNSSSSRPSGGGAVIVRQGETYSNARNFYGGRGDTLNYGASFFDIRPLAGMSTHWEQPTPIGAAQRFREVIEEGRHPGNQPGPVAQYWRDQYDRGGQITS